MTRLLPIISLCLSLLISACSTLGRTQPTQPHTVHPPRCSLTPCPLPGRPPLLVTDDWRRALDETEAALEQCAAQVLGCIERQRPVLLSD